MAKIFFSLTETAHEAGLVLTVETSQGLSVPRYVFTGPGETAEFDDAQAAFRWLDGYGRGKTRGVCETRENGRPTC